MDGEGRGGTVMVPQSERVQAPCLRPELQFYTVLHRVGRRVNPVSRGEGERTCHDA